MTNEMTIGKGKVVYITYSVLSMTGEVMGQQDIPIGYVQGAQSGLFEEVEAALEGCIEGQRVEAHLTPGRAFGDRDPNLVVVDEIDHVPPTIRFVGAEAQLQNDAGETMTFRVIEIADGKITLDANPPLAGREARCVATVVSIRDATAEEMRTGFPAEQGAPALH